MDQLFDTHAHYDDERFDPDRHALLDRMPREGVGLILNPGCDLPTSRAAVELAERYPFLYAAVGIHPENCADYTPADLQELRRLAQNPKVVAVGEIGLDYHWAENPPHERQQQAFRDQLALARELSLPVIVHDRDAHADSLAIVREFPEVQGVFHCFSGSTELAQQLLALGWYLGFDGPLTYSNARKTVAVAAMVPAHRMLLETDAPYLAPEPCRGQRNDSRLLCHVADKLAELRHTTPEAIRRQTAENGCRLFGIE